MSNEEREEGREKKKKRKSKSRGRVQVQVVKSREQKEEFGGEVLETTPEVGHGTLGGPRRNNDGGEN